MLRRQDIRLRDEADFERAVALLRDGEPTNARAVATMHPQPGRGRVLRAGRVREHRH